MREIILYFLKIGMFGFGGPMAHIAMMEEELVKRRRWISEEEFLSGLAVSNMLPGPASTQLGIYMGYMRKGVLGGILAGISFILPAFIIIIILSYIYIKYGTIPQVQGLLYGINPMVIALISISLYKMSKGVITNVKSFIILLFSATAMYFLNINIIIILILSGIVGVLIFHNKFNRNNYYSFLFPVIGFNPIITKLFTFFLKVGSFIYGGGLVVIPFIEQEVITNLGWLTQQEFLAGLSLGQITPGPVVITSAFIGYKVGGVLGGFVAAFAIFFPSFLFILIAAPYLKKIRNIPWVKAFLKGINAAVIGTILVTTLTLIPGAILDIWTFLIFTLGLIGLLKFKMNVFYSIGISGILGMVITYLI